MGLCHTKVMEDLPDWCELRPKERNEPGSHMAQRAAQDPRGKVLEYQGQLKSLINF